MVKADPAYKGSLDIGRDTECEGDLYSGRIPFSMLYLERGHDLEKDHPLALKDFVIIYRNMCNEMQLLNSGECHQSPEMGYCRVVTKST